MRGGDACAGEEMTDYLENKGGYCVACGIRYVPNEALKVCDESSAGLSHLWAKNGHCEEWFPFKRDRQGRLAASVVLLPARGKR